MRRASLAEFRKGRNCNRNLMEDVKRLHRVGRLPQETSGDNVDGNTSIAPLMGMETLLEGYRCVLTTIYAPKNYYFRLRTFLREYRGPGVRARAALGRQCDFIRDLFRLGLLGKERIQYWKILIWTLLHRPDLFSTMVSLAIYGFHFRKICERHLPDSEK